MTLEGTPQVFTHRAEAMFRTFRQLRIRTQVGRLRQQVSLGLAAVCATLVGIDLFFSAVYSADTLHSMYQGTRPTLGFGWRVGEDGSYSEVFGYLKTGLIASVLLLIPARRRRPIYLAMALVFTIVLLDDALRLHERLGDGLVAALDLESSLGWSSLPVGQMMVWTALGIPLIVGAGAAFLKSPAEDRANAILVMGGLGVLMLFAVVVDAIYDLVKNEFSFPGGGPLFIVIEETGEQIALSLICVLALLIYREVRSRERSALDTTRNPAREGSQAGL